MTTTIIVLSVLLILAVAYGVAMTLHNINQRADLETCEQALEDAAHANQDTVEEYWQLQLQHKALHQRFNKLKESTRNNGDPETPTYNDVAVEHNTDPSSANVQQATADNVGEPSFTDEMFQRFQRYIDFVFPGSTVEISDAETHVVDGLEISTGVIDIRVAEDITPEEYEQRLHAHPFQPTIEMLEDIERLNVAAAAEQQQPDDN